MLKIMFHLHRNYLLSFIICSVGFIACNLQTNESEEEQSSVFLSDSDIENPIVDDFYREYYQNGNIKVNGMLGKNAEKIGYWKTFDSTGMLIDLKFYQNGEIIYNPDDLSDYTLKYYSLDVLPIVFGVPWDWRLCEADKQPSLIFCSYKVTDQPFDANLNITYDDIGDWEFSKLSDFRLESMLKEYNGTLDFKVKVEKFFTPKNNFYRYSVITSDLKICMYTFEFEINHTLVSLNLASLQEDELLYDDLMLIMINNISLNENGE